MQHASLSDKDALRPTIFSGIGLDFNDNPLLLHSSARHSTARHVLRLYASEMSALARSDTHAFRILLLPPTVDGVRLTTRSARDETKVRK
ncbi:Uncharacterized protein HZ326_1950 [Fusarium oxysporum f. sp. albedinis]|nr:Uncharacterized protein HZ326_1950 [Fusarium oxysporum f. sp. albedinis]